MFQPYHFEKYFINDGLFVRKSHKGGLGVFTANDLDQNIIVEYNPFSSFVRYAWKDVPEPLRKIVFAHPIGSDSYVIGLGYLSLYNHDDDANCVWSTVDEGIYIYTRRKIKAGEELYIHYGDGYWSNGWEKL